jgi:hypothetical protein
MKKLMNWCFMLTVSAVSLFFFSCKKQTDEIATPAAEAIIPNLVNPALRPDETIQKLDNFAKIIAVLVQEEEVRELVKAKAMLKFDGDFDVLYSQIRNYRFRDGKTFEQKCFAINEPVTLAASALTGLQLSVPVLCEEWATRTFIPLTAVMPYGKEERTLATIKCYNPGARSAVQLPATTDPDAAAVVVGICERVDEHERLRPEFASTEGMARISGCNEIVEKIKCPNLGQIEAWSSGAPELWLKVYGVYTTSVQPPGAVPPGTLITSQFFKPGSRSAINNQFATFNRQLINWYTDPNLTSSVYSTIFQFAWMEEDYLVNGNGKDITIALSAPVKVKILGQQITLSPTLSFTWHIGNDDDDAGMNVVNFNDPITNIYSTGLVEWKENN